MSPFDPREGSVSRDAGGDYVLGVDLGGTSVSVAAIRSVGGRPAIGAVAEKSMKSATGPERGLALIGGLMEEVARSEGGRPLAFGIGATGPVIREKGIIDNPYTLPGWNQVDAVGALARRLGIRGTMENDADAFALGEWWAGEDRGDGKRIPYALGTRLYAMTIGTGIGTALVDSGKLYYGLGGSHPEGGHMVVAAHDGDGQECYCGARGCLESLVSGPGLSRLASRLAAERGGLMLELAGGDPAKADSRAAVAAARRGDGVALELFEKAGTWIGLGIVNVMSILLPEAIVIGGGLAAEFDLFEPAMRRTVGRANVMIPAKDVRIRASSLGRAGGMIGAAYAAFSKFGTEKGCQS